MVNVTIYTIHGSYGLWKSTIRLGGTSSNEMGLAHPRSCKPRCRVKICGGSGQDDWVNGSPVNIKMPGTFGCYPLVNIQKTYKKLWKITIFNG